MNRKLGRKSDHRNHMIRNLVTSLILYEKVETTTAKAKEIKSEVDRIILRNAKNDLVAKRNLFGYFFDKKAALKVIEELIPRYEKRTSGLVKSYHLQNRVGDNAPMMRLELVDRKVFVNKDKDSKSNKTEANSDAAVTVAEAKE